MESLGFENNHILDMPIHILSEIMIKLPALSIVQCGSVCTKFRSIVTDSSFQQEYFSRAPISCVVLSNHHHLSCIGCFAAQTETIPSNNGSSCMAAVQTPPPSKRRISPIQQRRWPFQSINRRSRFVTFHTHRRMNLINSSHGLLCLRSATNYRPQTRSSTSNTHLLSVYYICNPLLGEILNVPPPPTTVDENLCFSAFGFDPKSKNYKILQLVWKSNDKNELVAELYRLGDKDWSSTTVIESSSSSRSSSSSSSSSVKPKEVPPNSSFDPSINGALHWLTDSNLASELICSFDLNRNKFKWVAPPPHFDNNVNNNKISGMSLGVLKGCLCLCYVSEGRRFETWSMDKYGVKESWRKVFSIDIKLYCGLRPQDKHRPIGFNSCGDMWLRADSDSDSRSQCLVSFSAETGVFRHIDIGTGDVASTIQATPQVLSYVSLKDMLILPGTNIGTTHLKLQTLRTDKNYAFGLFPI